MYILFSIVKFPRVSFVFLAFPTFPQSKSSKKDFSVKKRERAKTSKLWNGSEKPNFRFLRRSLSA